MTFNDLLDREMHAQRRSQSSVARALGMNPQSFNDRMHGRTRWGLYEAVAVVIELRIDLDELMDVLFESYAAASAPVSARRAALAASTPL